HQLLACSWCDMDSVNCPYCSGRCLYKDHSLDIENLIELLIPNVTGDKRHIEISLNDWRVTAKIYEGEILVGKILVNRLDRSEDFLIDNYFLTPRDLFPPEEYIAKLLAEIKMFYEADEFHDGEHPILIKVNVTI